MRCTDTDQKITVALIDDCHNISAFVEANKKTDPNSIISQLAKKVGLPRTVFALLSGECGKNSLDCSIGATAWQGATDLRINHDDFPQTLPISYNPACVTEISLPRRIIVGCCIIPRIRLEFGLLDDCQMVWTKKHAKDQERTVIGYGPMYTPTDEDIGSTLALDVLPSDGHQKPGIGAITDSHGFFRRRFGDAAPAASAASAETPGMRKGWADTLVTAGRPPPPPPTVEPFPALWPLHARHAAARARPTPALRVCTYNLLCDQFCDTERGRAQLFAAVPAAGLHAHFRAQLAVRELVGYDADIVSLQEVEVRAFHAPASPAQTKPRVLCKVSCPHAPKIPKTRCPPPRPGGHL